MTSFDQKFIENPQFVRWIFRPSRVVDQYWNQYISDHPEEKDQLLELKQRLSELQHSNDLLLRKEKEEIAQRLLNRIKPDSIPTKQGLIFRSFLKYAAVAIAFAFIGGLVVYSNMDKDFGYQELSSQMIAAPSSTQGPLLITSTGENVNLKKDNSSVDYSQKGTIILNNDSVIQTTQDIPDVLNQLVIPYGTQSRVVLSDNTVVWLNSGSRLVYPTVFDDKIREVILVGEAFFEVSKNPEKPFVVRTSDLSIKVLGTQFNISAYAEDKIIQTVLTEGSISIKRNDAAFYEKDLILKPDQMASFNRKSFDTRVYEVDVSYYTLWTKGLLSFEEIDFNRILKKVERFYNITVRFSEPILGDIRISGKLDLKQNRDEVLEYLAKVSLTKIEKINESQYLVNK